MADYGDPDPSGATLRTTDESKAGPRAPEPEAPTGWRSLVGSPWVAVAAILGIVLVMGWQFISDPSRGVPALDTAWYQWRAEYLQANEPGDLIRIEGAQGALAGGYRIAEPVTGALMRTVGGVGPGTHTVVLSVLFRVLAAAAMAAFAWRHRRSWLLFYLTLAVIPALFLLQQFFGFMDNFFALGLMAGVLLAYEPMRRSWTARFAVATFLFLGGMTHPTTLVLFLLSIGAVLVYRFIRDRSLLSALRADGAMVIAGIVAVALTVAFWMGGLWGPTSSLSEAAVPPPEDLDYFVNRSLTVLKGMYPWILLPVMAIGFIALAVALFKRKERFSELTLGWSLPLAGVLGFLIGAAYPYFRFFNSTLAPLVAVAVGFAAIIGLGSKLKSPSAARIATGALGLIVAVVLGFWWTTGIQSWSNRQTWLSPQVRTQMAAASAYLDAEPEGRQAVFIGDADPEGVVPYGAYKEFANATYAGLDGDQIDDAYLWFGTAEDLLAGQASTTDDEQYNDMAGDTAREVLPVLEENQDNVVLFIATAFNESSSNLDYPEECSEVAPQLLGGSASCPVEIGGTGLYVSGYPALVTLGRTGTDVDASSVAAAEDAATEASAFAANPPGPFDDLGGTLMAILRLGLLFVLPGWLLFRRFPERSWVEGLAMVPLLSISAVTVAGMVLTAVFRAPFGAAMGWGSLGVATAVGVAANLRPRREPKPIKLLADAGALFEKRDFSFLMGAQWFAQAADGLVGVALAKLIAFGGQKGFSLEEARSPEDALRIALLTFLPYMFVSPFLGVLIDRWNRRRLLVGANALRVAVLALIVLVGIETVGDAALFGSFLLVLAGTRLLLAIKGASLPTVLGERDLMQGNAISQAGSAIFQLGGAGLALVASGLLDTRIVLIGGVVAYGVATLCAIGVRKLGTVERRGRFSEELRRILGNLKEGIGTVRRTPQAALSLASFLGLRSLVTFVVLSVGFGSRAFIAEEGTLTSAIPAGAGALGAALGFVVAHSLKDRVPPARLIVGAMLFGGVGVAVFGDVTALLPISIVAFIVGLCFFMGKISVDTLMQQSLADTFRGRGFGLQDVVYNLSWILPSLVLWAAWTPGNARGLLVAAGVAFVVAGLAVAAWARRIAGRDAEALPAQK